MKMKKSFVCLLAIVAAVYSSGSAEATPLYSFEGENDPNGINENVEGFFGTSAAFTITQSTIGATDGANSMKIFLAKGPGFVGARTETIPAALFNPPGVDGILFDLTIEPGDEYAGGFSVIGITIFGDDGGSVQEQYVDEFHIDGLAAGTYTVKIDFDVSHNGNSFNEIFHSGVGGATITLFQFLFNQSAGQGPGADDVIVYIDNIRVIPEPISVALFGVCAMVLSLGVRRRSR